MNNLDTGSSRTGIQPRIAALISGAGLLVMAVIAAASNFAVIQSTISPGNAAATAENIMASAGMFRLGAVGLVIVAVLDVIVAWGLYELFRKVNPAVSLLGAWLRLAYAAIFALAIKDLFTAARIASSDPAGAFMFTDSFNDGWMIGQIFFGLHLGVVGALALQSRFVHWLFGVLLVIAGAGYLFDGIAALLNPSFGIELALFTFVGEIAFIFWLLIRGVRLAAR